MARQHKIGKTATTVATDSNGVTRVTYHSTVVVAFDKDTITLCHGGWKTPTTKTRMNQASRQLELGFDVSQKDGNWTVRTKASQYGFSNDCFTFDRKTGLYAEEEFIE